MAWAQFDSWGHVAGSLGAIRAMCRAWQAFKLFWPWAYFPQHPRGWCLRIPYPGVRTEDLDANRVFLLVDGTRAFPYFCTELRATTLPPSSSPAP